MWVWVSAFDVFRLGQVISPQLTQHARLAHLSLSDVSSVYSFCNKKVNKNFAVGFVPLKFLSRPHIFCCLGLKRGLTAAGFLWCCVLESRAVYPLHLSATDIDTAGILPFLFPAEAGNQFAHLLIFFLHWAKAIQPSPTKHILCTYSLALGVKISWWIISMFASLMRITFFPVCKVLICFFAYFLGTSQNDSWLFSISPIIPRFIPTHRATNQLSLSVCGHDLTYFAGVTASVRRSWGSRDVVWTMSKLDVHHNQWKIALQNIVSGVIVGSVLAMTSWLE